MTLNESLKEHRNKKGLSQEKLAELMGISRQAVTKWENGQSTPSSENLIALASIYGISTDELLEMKLAEPKQENKILQSNLTLIAITLQAAALNVCIQPMSPEEYGLPYAALLLFKIVPLLACSCWMTHNLKYEKNIVQYRKNVWIEWVYCLIQLGVALFAYFSSLLFLGALLILAIALFYVFVINPKYMNRTLTRKKL